MKIALWASEALLGGVLVGKVGDLT